MTTRSRRSAITQVDRPRHDRWSTIRKGERLAGTPYRILAARGAGGTAQVYEACRLRDGERVALKILCASLQNRDELRRRMSAEAAALRSVSSRAVVSLLDEGRTAEGRPYIVTELLTGRTLRAHLQRFGAVSPPRARRFVAAVLSGLAAVHRAGLVHCDVKLDNIQLGHDGRVTLLDFGSVEPLARSTFGGFAERPALGTPRYMSPEQQQGRCVDAGTDVYAAGLLLLELLLGGWPFLSAKDTRRCLDAVRIGAPPDWLASDISAPLLDVIGRATACARHERYADAHAMTRALFGLRPVFDGTPGHEPAQAAVGRAVSGIGDPRTGGSVREEQLVVRGHIPVHRFEMSGSQLGGLTAAPLHGVEMLGDLEAVDVAEADEAHRVPVALAPDRAGEGLELAVVAQGDFDVLHHRRWAANGALDQCTAGAQVEGAAGDRHTLTVSSERTVSSYSEAVASFHGGRDDHVGECKCGIDRPGSRISRRVLWREKARATPEGRAISRRHASATHRS